MRNKKGAQQSAFFVEFLQKCSCFASADQMRMGMMM